MEHKMNNKHTLMMVLCCVIPIATFAALWYFGLTNGYWAYAVMLLCPVLHGLMMYKMPGKCSLDHNSAEKIEALENK